MTSYISQHTRNLSYQNLSSQYSKIKFKHFSYSLGDKIGKGYSSVVYKGTNQTTNKTVAIKAIDMKGVKDSVSREMLECEILALKTLDSQHVLKCHDVVRESAYCYIVTQYCNEGDLSSYLKKKGGRLSEQEVICIVSDILNGFIEIGEKKFLHRDLKLANIFMNDGSAIIADFGFSKKDTNLPLRQKYNVGSPLYMSPEALKKNIYSIKNDIWSIGIMTYELLYGTTPWNCKTQQELIEKMTKISVKFKEQVNVSAQLKEFIKKCLEVDQLKRCSLDDLKVWRQRLFNKSSKRLGKVLSQISKENRLSSKSQYENYRFSTNRFNLPPKTDRSSLGNQQNKIFFTLQDKQNQNSKRPVSNILSKDIISKNNNIMVVQINKFRLIYKIVEKLKKYQHNSRDLIAYLGNDMIKRVSDLMNFVSYSNKYENDLAKFGLKQVSKYFDEELNASIRKYKMVINEYFKKYTTEYQISSITSYHSPQIAKQKLLAICNKRLFDNSYDEEIGLMIFLILEHISMKPTVTKDHLDSILQGKSVKKSVLQAKFKQLTK